MTHLPPPSAQRRLGCWLVLLFPALGLLLSVVAYTNAQRSTGVRESGELAPGDAAPIVVDRPAPDFSAQSPDGQTISLHALRGKLVALNFWATWCEPCRTEMPELQAAAGRHAGLAVLAVDAGEPADSVQAFASSLGLSFRIVLDPASEIRDRYGVRVFPTTVWVDSAGVARVKHIGTLTRAFIERYVTTLGAE